MQAVVIIWNRNRSWSIVWAFIPTLICRATSQPFAAVATSQRFEPSRCKFRSHDIRSATPGASCTSLELWISLQSLRERRRRLGADSCLGPTGWPWLLATFGSVASTVASTPELLGYKTSRFIFWNPLKKWSLARHLNLSDLFVFNLLLGMIDIYWSVLFKRVETSNQKFCST